MRRELRLNGVVRRLNQALLIKMLKPSIFSNWRLHAGHAEISRSYKEWDHFYVSRYWPIYFIRTYNHCWNSIKHTRARSYKKSKKLRPIIFKRKLPLNARVAVSGVLLFDEPPDPRHEVRNVDVNPRGIRHVSTHYAPRHQTDEDVPQILRVLACVQRGTDQWTSSVALKL